VTPSEAKRLARQEAKSLAAGYLQGLLYDMQVFEEKFGQKSQADQNRIRNAIEELSQKLMPKEATVTREELIAKMETAYRQAAKEQGWRPSELAMTLSGVPKEVDKLIRNYRRKLRKAK
jgi:hypothetical protein